MLLLITVHLAINEHVNKNKFRGKLMKAVRRFRKDDGDSKKDQPLPTIFQGWKSCASENAKCTFSGKRIVKFGLNKTWAYTEIENTVDCKSSAFGNKKIDGEKKCLWRQHEHTWKKCADQNDKCHFPGTTLIKYGTEDKFFIKKGDVEVDCNNTYFGDPDVGKEKHCYYLVTEPANEWTECSKENAKCTFGGRKLIRYGVEGKWLYKESKDSIDCKTETFGKDPAPKTPKRCDTRNAPHAWETCAGEGQKCVFSGTAFVKYGIDGKYTIRKENDNVMCSNSVFGDPNNKKRKMCYILINNPWIKCADESSKCSFEGKRVVKYGSGEKWNYREASGNIKCDTSTFGDPKSDGKKECFYRKEKHQWMKCGEEGGTCNFKGKNQIMKYGAKDKWKYKLIKDKASCNSETFGEVTVTKGTIKECFYLVKDPWIECGYEDDTCNTGEDTVLIKYGYHDDPNEKFKYMEATGSVPCTVKHFGDPSPGKKKSCYIRRDDYFWVQCATEGAKCDIKGPIVVRYGSKGSFVYQYHSKPIDCNGNTFKGAKPAESGEKNKCEYAVYNLSPPLKIVEELKQVVKPGMTKEEAVEFSKCSSDGAFGFEGTCASKLFSPDNEKSAPSKAKKPLKFLFRILEKVMEAFNFCIGDFDGAKIASDSALAASKCNTIPLMQDFKYGLIGASVSQLPCGATPVSVEFCTVFDKCGTVAIATNAGILQCAATYSTGIAAILSPLTEILDHVALGFSLKRRFTSGEFEIIYLDGDSVASKKVVTYGHFFLQVGFTFPFEEIKFGKYTIKDFIDFNVKGRYLLDFSGVDESVNKIIDTIENGSKDAGKQIINTIINTNIEMTLNLTGSLTLKFSDLTKGILPDLVVDLFDVNILVTNGNGGASGLDRGVYIFVRGISLSSILNAIIKQFNGILKIFGIKIPEIGKSNSNSFGLFITDKAVGFQVKLLGFTIKCSYIYDKEKLSCGVDHVFFTAIKEAAEWVIKHARKFFDETGKAIVRFANDVGKFVENCAKEVENFFKNDVKNFFERDVKDAFVTAGNEIKDFFVEDVGEALEDAANEVKDFFVEDVGGAIKDAANDVKDFFVDDVGGAFKSAGKAIKNFFSGWKKRRMFPQTKIKKSIKK